MTTPPSNESPSETYFKCKHCSERFRRDDHLRRHELSHGFPRFLCEHPDCGMRFHRKDVLQRHQLVHQPNPTKKRRKPRRGVLPRGPIQACTSQAASPELNQAPDPARDQTSPFPPLGQSAVANLASIPSLTADTPGSNASLSLEPFNFSTELNMGLEDLSHDSPILDDGFGRFQALTWADVSMPLDFNFASGQTYPQYPASMSNADPFILSTNISPTAETAYETAVYPMTLEHMQICLEKFRRMFLPRIPFLHHSTFAQESLYSALGLSMVTVGAMYINEHRHKAPLVYRLALEALKQQSHVGDNYIRNMQASILLIDFAAWYGDAELRQWGIREQHVLAQHTNLGHMHAKIEPLTYDDWGQWKKREEIKRTILAYFVTSILITTFHPVASPIVPPPHEITLPCPESVWDATNEHEWRTRVDELGLRYKKEINFPEAAFAMLRNDTTHATDYELATVFGQYILLCVIVNSFNLSIRLPASYATFEAWRTKDMTQFRPSINIDGALNLWVDLWWASPDSLWDSNVPANARIEAIFLHQHTTLRLHKNNDFRKDRPDERYKPIRTATESFVSVSKNGFQEVATYACHILSVSCYYIAIELARTTIEWLANIASPEYGELTKRDTEIVTRLRQALRRNNVTSTRAARAAGERVGGVKGPRGPGVNGGLSPHNGLRAHNGASKPYNGRGGAGLPSRLNARPGVPSSREGLGMVDDDEGCGWQGGGGRGGPSAGGPGGSGRAKAPDASIEELLRQISALFGACLGGDEWRRWNMGEGDGPFSVAVVVGRGKRAFCSEGDEREGMGGG